MSAAREKVTTKFEAVGTDIPIEYPSSTGTAPGTLRHSGQADGLVDRADTCVHCGQPEDHTVGYPHEFQPRGNSTPGVHPCLDEAGIIAATHPSAHPYPIPAGPTPTLGSQPFQKEANR